MCFMWILKKKKKKKSASGEKNLSNDSKLTYQYYCLIKNKILIAF